MINVEENQDGSFTISWDPNDPIESQLNHFTEQDFIDAIMEQCDRALEELAHQIPHKAPDAL